MKFYQFKEILILLFILNSVQSKQQFQCSIQQVGGDNICGGMALLCEQELVFIKKPDYMEKIMAKIPVNNQLEDFLCQKTTEVIVSNSLIIPSIKKHCLFTELRLWYGSKKTQAIKKVIQEYSAYEEKDIVINKINANQIKNIFSDKQIQLYKYYIYLMKRISIIAKTVRENTLSISFAEIFVKKIFKIDLTIGIYLDGLSRPCILKIKKPEHVIYNVNFLTGQRNFIEAQDKTISWSIVNF